ncbi:MAG: cyclase family protein [Solirubrobacteraceae bacterium]
MSVDTKSEIGNLALIDDAKRASALAEVRAGRMYDLGHVLDEHVPVFPGRYFKQTLVTTAHHANPGGGVGENEVNWITELVSGTMQLGTHLDALSHLQMGDRGYGGSRCANLPHRRRHATGRRDRPADRDTRLARRCSRARARRSHPPRRLPGHQPRAR